MNQATTKQLVPPAAPSHSSVPYHFILLLAIRIRTASEEFRPTALWAHQHVFHVLLSRVFFKIEDTHRGWS